MVIAVFDIDGVFVEPEYPHPRLLADVSSVVGLPYSRLFEHYSTRFKSNLDEEQYHLSLCNGEKLKEEEVKAFWWKMEENKGKAHIVPGARELLELVSERGWVIYAWTKGEAGIQRKKLGVFGLSDFFQEDRLLWSPRKGTAEGIEQDLLPMLPKGRKILVGDSWEQDILPTIGLEDFTCIWISGSETYARTPKPDISESDHTNLIIVRSTQEFATKLKEGLLNV